MTVTSAIGIVIAQSLWATIQRLFGFAPEIPSPKVRVGWKDWNYTFDIDGHTGVLTVKNLPPVYAISPQDTKSMLPVLGTGHLGMMTKDFKIDGLAKGDTIMYQHGRGTIFHSIAGIFEDSKGVFFICKGVNCFFPDPYGIRPSQVISLMRLVIY